MCIDRRGAWQSGLSLIELIVFIVIVSVGVVGLVSVMSSSIRFSADPMRSKQLLAVAESVLSEVLHQPFTWCDPDDPAVSTAQKYTDCTIPQNTLSAAPSTEDRYGMAVGAGYDNVADYGTFSKANIDDASGNNAMTGYTASVAVARAGTALGLSDDTAALSVTVTVQQGNDMFSLTGYRFRYAPRY